MQVKEINHSDFAFDLCQSFINDKSCFDEIPASLPLSSETIAEEKNANTTTPKGKGRPKG